MISNGVPGDSGIQPPQRLWTPWRMSYVGGSRQSGCVFCNVLESDDDVASLIVHRGDHTFVILNLYPYNTGHLMVVPNAHVSYPAELSAAARAEMAELSASFCAGLRLVMGCDGLNTGMNLGSAAGAGIADHLHQHIVPRWIGDANFMPIVGGTKVLPELLPATYAKIRAEVARQKSATDVVRLVLLDPARDGVYLQTGTLPRVDLMPDEPVWRAAMAALAPFATRVELQGWAGASSTKLDAVQSPALAASFTPPVNSQRPYAFLALDDARLALVGDEQAILKRAMARYG